MDVRPFGDFCDITCPHCKTFLGKATSKLEESGRGFASVCWYCGRPYAFAGRAVAMEPEAEKLYMETLKAIRGEGKEDKEKKDKLKGLLENWT